MLLLLHLLLLFGCNFELGFDSIASANDDVPLPDNIAYAIAYQPEAIETCMSELNSVILAEREQALKSHYPGHKSDTKNSFHAIQKFLECTSYDKKLSYASFLQTSCLSAIRRKFSLSNAQLKQLLPHLPDILDKDRSISPELDPMQCPYPIDVECSPMELYRTYDGRCNNLKKPLWGSSHYPLARFLQSDYADAISKPRVARSGNELPNARLVSYSVHRDIDRSDIIHTLLLMLFGQFLDHDLSLTAISTIATDVEGTEVLAVECGEDGCQTEGPENRECLPIFIPENDPFFGGSKSCLMFVRSLGVPNENCEPGPREQVNDLTSFMDASMVYGNTEDNALALREITPGRGRMKTANHPAGFKSLLPLKPGDEGCRAANSSISCFIAGDKRVNVYSPLAMAHTIWVREHNRIEQKLHELNPHWDGERLYQETRRIVAAEWQYTVFNEYLPIIVGDDAMITYGLQLTKTGYWNGYNENIKPDITNSFATAAFRYGHVQIQGTVSGRDNHYNVVDDITLSRLFFNPVLMWEHPDQGMDMMMRGVIGDSSLAQDQFMTKQVTCHLFTNNPPDGVGLDLAALNIQRGRDHGIPTYNRWREWCGLKRAKTFDDLVDIPADTIDQYRQLYECVDDIDLWSAGVSERPCKGALVGPTFSCMLARQFQNLKRGDRFWHEDNFNNPYPFTEAQLAEIRKFTYARVMCDNSDNLIYIQPNVFQHPLSVVYSSARNQNRPVNMDQINDVYSQSDNERVPCADIPVVNLDPWVERFPTHPIYAAPGVVEALACSPSRGVYLSRRF